MIDPNNIQSNLSITKDYKSNLSITFPLQDYSTLYKISKCVIVSSLSKILLVSVGNCDQKKIMSTYFQINVKLRANMYSRQSSKLSVSLTWICTILFHSFQFFISSPLQNCPYKYNLSVIFFFLLKLLYSTYLPVACLY